MELRVIPVRRCQLSRSKFRLKPSGDAPITLYELHVTEAEIMESRIRCGSKECSNPVGQQPVLDKRLTGGRAMIRFNQPQALLICP